MIGTKSKTKTSLFQKINLTANEFVVLIYIVSSFISVYLQAALILLLPIYIFASGQIKKALPGNKYGYFLLAFAMLACVSTFLFAKDAVIFEMNIKAIYLKLLGIGIILLAFCIFFYANIMTKRAFEYALKVSAAMSLICVLIAVIQRIFHLYPDPVLNFGRVASVFLNPNYYGTAIEFYSIIALFCFFRKKSIKSRVFFAIVFVLNIVALWLCQTRTSFVVIVIAIFVFFFFYNRKISYYLLFFLALCFLVLVKNPPFLPRFDQATAFWDLDFRFGIWKTTIEAFLENPVIGRGYFSYSGIWSQYGGALYPAMHAHNIFLECLLNFGILGTLMFAIFCVCTTCKCIANSFKHRNMLYLALIFSAVASIFVHGMADTTIFWPQTGIFAVLILACPGVYSTAESQEE